MYYTYMMRCKDNSIYTGITSDLERRKKEHFEKSEKCAKYTFTHTAVKLEQAWETETRQSASKLEYYIKTLNKQQKEELIKKPNKIEEFLSEKVESQLYKPIK